MKRPSRRFDEALPLPRLPGWRLRRRRRVKKERMAIQGVSSGTVHSQVEFRARVGHRLDGGWARRGCRGSASGYRVDGYALVPLPPGAATASNISDANAIGEAIRRAIEHAGCKAKKAALAVPGSAAITKLIAMDASLTDDELEAAITVEADRHLPFQADQVAFDFEPLHLSASDPSQVDVLLAACRRQHVERLEEVAAHVGLQAAVVDIEPFCLARAAQLLRAEGEETPLALAAIGATTTSLLVVARDAAIFTREEPFAAERLHTGAGGGSGGEELLRLLSRLLRLFLSRHPETPPRRLLFAGSGASRSVWRSRGGAAAFGHRGRQSFRRHGAGEAGRRQGAGVRCADAHDCLWLGHAQL